MAGWRRLRWLGGALALLGGAGVSVSSFRAGRPHDGTDVPTHRPWAQPFGVAWVFSSGGPRGFVHVGVLQALAELGLKPDLIVGASAGALAGSQWPAGLWPCHLKRPSTATTLIGPFPEFGCC